MEKSVIKFSAEGMRELTNQSQHSLENKEFQNVKEKIYGRMPSYYEVSWVDK